MKYIIGALRWLYDFLAEDNLLMLGTIVSLLLLFAIVALGGENFAGPLFFLFIVAVLFLSLRAEAQRSIGKLTTHTRPLALCGEGAFLLRQPYQNLTEPPIIDLATVFAKLTSFIAAGNIALP